MKKNQRMHLMIPIILMLVGSLLLSSCGVRGNVADPASWGYECTVTYNALGGTINSRGIRQTNYMKNSYVFKPSGTTNMLIEPVKDGFILAGWYTAKEDIKDAGGNVTGYSFKSEDRWDFDEDRVQGDMALYARWIPQGKADYIDASTDEVKFSKNVTVDSPVKPLSGAAEMLIAKKGYSFDGYYADKDGTVPYDFSAYNHQALIPSNEEVYAQLSKDFPQYFKQTKYVEPSGEEEDNLIEDTSDLFVNKLGYEITTDDQAAREKIRERKDKIYDDAIKYYIENASSKVIYLKYSEGSYARITSPDDLKHEGKYGFSGLDKAGNPVDGYIIANNLDFNGLTLEPVESFSGKIIGNGYSLKNITISVKSKKVDKDTSKIVGMFQALDGAYIENVNFENMNITLNVNSGTKVTVGALAAQANNTELKNIKFTNLTINTGRGDDGAATYKVGDLFASQRNNKLENVTGSNVTITASEFAEVNSLLQQ